VSSGSVEKYADGKPATVVVVNALDCSKIERSRNESFVAPSQIPITFAAPVVLFLLQHHFL
jgi:hypothetical protein